MSVAAIGSVRMRPARLFADVRGQEEVRVQAAADDGPAEGRLVELRGAGRDDDPVEPQVLDVVDDGLLALVGAHEHDVARDRDAVQAAASLRDPVDVDDVGDVAAAVADVDADPLAGRGPGRWLTLALRCCPVGGSVWSAMVHLRQGPRPWPAPRRPDLAHLDAERWRGTSRAERRRPEVERRPPWPRRSPRRPCRRCPSVPRAVPAATMPGHARQRGVELRIGRWRRTRRGRGRRR